MTDTIRIRPGKRLKRLGDVIKGAGEHIKTKIKAKKPSPWVN